MCGSHGRELEGLFWSVCGPLIFICKAARKIVRRHALIAHDRTNSIYYYSRVPPGCVVVDIAINESGKGFTIRSGSFDGADFHGNVPGKGRFY